MSVCDSISSLKASGLLRWRDYTSRISHCYTNASNACLQQIHFIIGSYRDCGPLVCRMVSSVVSPQRPSGSSTGGGLHIRGCQPGGTLHVLDRFRRNRGHRVHRFSTLERRVLHGRHLRVRRRRTGLVDFCLGQRTEHTSSDGGNPKDDTAVVRVQHDGQRTIVNRLERRTVCHRGQEEIKDDLRGPRHGNWIAQASTRFTDEHGLLHRNKEHGFGDSLTCGIDKTSCRPEYRSKRGIFDRLPHYLKLFSLLTPRGYLLSKCDKQLLPTIDSDS